MFFVSDHYALSERAISHRKGIAMIIVTGSVTASPETDAEMAEHCLAHVRRSRTEPGCVLHSVHRDVENHHRFVFLEQWESRAALDQHFDMPESIAFVTAIRGLAADATKMQIFETIAH